MKQMRKATNYFLTHFYCKVFIFCLLVPPTLYAQTTGKVDSLLQALSVSQPDTQRVLILNALCWHFRNSDFAKANEYGKESLALALTLGYYKGATDANSFIGVVYRNMGEYGSSLNYFYDALRIAEKAKLQQQIAYSYNNIGDILKTQKQYPEAEKYIQKAIDLFDRIKDERGLGYGYIRLGEVFQSRKEYDRALNAYSKSLEIREKIGDKGTIESALLRIGQVYGQKGEYTRGLAYLNRALEISRELKDKRGIANTLADISGIYLQKKDYKKSIDLGRKSLQLADSIGAREILKKSSKLLSDAYLKSKDNAKALEYLNIYIAVNDSLLNEENNKKLFALHKNYELDKKQVEIDFLNRNQRMQTILIIALVVVLILVALFTFSLIRSNRLKKNINEILKKQKEEIETTNEQLHKQKQLIEKKNEDITSSITYAQRIQQAFLPPREEIARYLPDFFIYYQPRDIVSGDFYWFAHKPGENGNSKLILAAVDCTGHGVPGAFMSMIGDSLLNQVIHDKEIHAPDLILNELHTGIQKTLNQYQTKNQDGMDMALCTIDLQHRKMEFAGAGNPLYICQNGELTQIKGSIHSLGGLQKEIKREFEKQVIDIQEPTVFYIFSDGYQDQIGGPENKKFYVKRFRDLLHSIHHLPMQEQAKILDATMKEWKGKENQLDDMMVIGVKI